MNEVKYAEYVNRLFAKSAKRGIPLSGTFELTARCNLRCRMCYIHREENDSEIKTDEFSSEEWLNIAKEAQQCGMLFLLLTGGEPFIRPDFEEIYRRCRELGIIVSINTNGTMLGEKQVELLRKLPPQRVNITLYGASEATYEKLCRSGSAFERAYRAVAMLTEAGVPVKINYSVTPYNIGDLDAVERFANEHNLPLQAATYMFPPVRADENSEISPCKIGECETCERFTPEESAAARWAHELRTLDPAIIEKRAEAVALNTDIPPTETECGDIPTERIRCRAGAAAFWITYNGQLRPCGMMCEPSASLKERGFSAAWNDIRAMRENIMVPAKCTACRFRNICEACPAVCFAENERFDAEPTFMCKKMDAYTRLAAEYHKRR